MTTCLHSLCFQDQYGFYHGVTVSQLCICLSDFRVSCQSWMRNLSLCDLVLSKDQVLSCLAICFGIGGPLSSGQNEPSRI